MEVSKENVRNIYPLSPTQEGFLFHHLAGEDPLAYIQQISYHVRGPLLPRLFEAAWNGLIRRHDILRTALVHSGAKRPLQVVLKERPLDFKFEDVSGLSAAAQQAFIGRFREQDRHTPFDPARAMLNRVALIRLAPDDHEVVWSHHHMITDGWSVGLLQNELVQTYEALAEGRTPELEAAPPYSRYIRYLESLDQEASARYWSGYLRGYSRAAAIPASGAARIVTARDVNQCSRQLSSDLTSRLEVFARECRVTLSTVLQTIWGVLLGRYNVSPGSGGMDVVFGSVVSGRPPEVPGIDRMVGIFVNTIPLRVRADSSSPLRDVLNRVQRDVLEREPHQYFPLVKIQAGSELKQNLVPILAAMENYPVERQMQATRTSQRLGYSVDRVQVFERTHADFLVQFLPGDSLTFRFQYNAGVHREKAVERLADQLQRLLETAVADEFTTVGSMHAAIAADDSAGPYVRFAAVPIHRRIEARAAANPLSVAISRNGDSLVHEELTYGEMNARANRLARLLQSLGVGREDRVGICCDRSAGLIVSMLAVLKAGGAYVPIDPVYPAERVAFLLADSAVSIVIADATGLTALPVGLRTISPADGAEFPLENLAGEPCPAQAAYIIYTSGSTGQPKGCVVTHENVSRLFAATEDRFRFGPADVWTMFHSAAFDFSVWEIWGALIYGGRLVIVPYWVSRSPAEFAGLLEAERVTVLNQTPSAFRQLLAAGLVERADKLALRVVVFGGEALNFQSLGPWFLSPLAGRAQLVNMYGITETTVHVTWRVIEREDAEAARGSMIGVPIPDLSLYLLDALGHAAPHGATGEIHVGGAGVARGYWKRPALTASRFVPDPSGSPGGRMYSSGDLARRTGAGDPEDDLAYMGRADGQVKIRGFRIEPGEIESVIGRHPDVREVAVVSRDDGGDRFLAAYIAGPADEGCFDEIRASLRDRLPAYMMPAAFVLLDRLPLTAHGKTDRTALPAPNRVQATTYKPPSGPVQEAIADVWSQVLGIARIGVHDNYLELGGDSITAIRIVAALQQRQLVVGVRDLFRFPTIAELAPCAQRGRNGVRSARAPDEGPLSPAQAQFFAEHTLDPHWFNHAVFVCMPSGVSTEHLQQVWNALWARHDALRLRFFPAGTAHRQGLSSAACPPVESIDLSRSGDAEEELSGHANRAQTGFDLARGPLLRLVVFQMPSETRLLIVLHHLVVDAVSWQILLEDFRAAYSQAESGRPIALPPASGSFLQWCKDLAAFATSAEFQDELSYWDELSYRKETDGPESFSKTGVADTYGDAAAVGVRLARPDTEDLLRNALSAYNNSTEELLLAALACALRDWTGESDTKILLESHGRGGFEDLDLSRTVGWFTSIYPVTLRCHNAGDIAGIVKRTKETLRRVPRQGLGFGIRKYLSNSPAPGSAHPSIRFNYLGNPRAQLPSGRFTLTTDGVGRTVSPAARRAVAIDLSAIVLDSQLEFSATYSRFSEASISELLSLWRRRVGDVIRHCCGRNTSEVTPSDLTFSDLSLEEFDRMLQ